LTDELVLDEAPTDDADIDVPALDDAPTDDADIDVPALDEATEAADEPLFNPVVQDDRKRMKNGKLMAIVLRVT
jgi:hypothetical protein